MNWTLWTAGDFIPVENSETLNDPAFCMNEESKSYIRNQTLSLLNLETPLISNGQPLLKVGPAFKANPVYASVLKDLGINGVNLANNHMGDFGLEGIKSTIQILSKYEIKTFGAGANFEYASKAVFFDIGSIRIGLLGCSEVQFGTARYDRAGVYAPESYQLLENTYKTKNQCDVLIVSMHAGDEWSPWPSPQRVELFRTLVDSGVSVVIGHHSHMPQGYEKYGSGIIFYGLGNFWFPLSISWKDRTNYRWGLSPSIKFNGNVIEDCMINLNKINDNNSVSITNLKESGSEYVDYINKCNNPLTNTDFLTGIWQEISLRRYEKDISKVLGWSTDSLVWPIKEFLKISIKKSRQFYEQVHRRLIARCLSRWLFLSCSSQHNIICTALGVISGELSDLRTPETKDYVDQIMPWTVDRKNR